MNRRWMVTRFLSVAGVLVFCTAAEPSQAQSPAPGAAPSDTFKIGVLTDMGLSFSDATGPGSVVATKMAIADFGGEILGKKIELVVGDHQDKPDIAAGIAGQWYDWQGVSAIFDLVTSPVSLAVQALAKSRPSKAVIVTGGLSPELTGKACTANSIHWAPDTYAVTHGIVKGLVEGGADTWFFLSVDNAGGRAQEHDGEAAVTSAGGKVLGAIRYPINNSDFSSFIVQGQASKAKVLSFSSTGSDLVNAIKQASEFGVFKSGTRIAAFTLFITDVYSIGLPLARGIAVSTTFYWDQDEPGRQWSRRFFDAFGKMPTDLQANEYGAVTHYLQAVKAANTDDAAIVVPLMRKTPVNNFMTHNGKIRADGQLVQDMEVVQVKSPEESHYPWDFFRVISHVPGDQAFSALADSACPLVQKSAN